MLTLIGIIVGFVLGWGLMSWWLDRNRDRGYFDFADNQWHKF